MFTSLWIFEIVMLGVASGTVELSANISSFSFDAASCEEFGRDDPISPDYIVASLWRIFYYWAEGMENSTILFSLPSEEKMEDLKNLVNATHPDVNISWDNAILFMEPRPGIRVLFIRNIYNGSYTAIVKTEETDEDGSRSKPLVRVTEVRMKMADHVLGIAYCIDHTAFALAPVSEMPRTKSECITAAASLGLDTRIGKSYLTVPIAHDEL